MTIYARIAEYFHTLISKFLNEDDEELDLAGAIEGDLTEYVETLNKETNVIPMARARPSHAA